MLALIGIGIILFSLQGGVSAITRKGKLIIANGQYQCMDVYTKPTGGPCSTVQAVIADAKSSHVVPLGEGGIFGRFQNGGSPNMLLPADYDKDTGHMVMTNQFCPGDTIQTCLVVYPQIYKDNVWLFAMEHPIHE